MQGEGTRISKEPGVTGQKKGRTPTQLWSANVSRGQLTSAEEYPEE